MEDQVSLILDTQSAKMIDPNDIPENSCYDNSMLDSFRTCNRKFFFQHVRHWKPVKASIHLGFGSAWHGGMDVLWSQAKSSLTNKEIIELAFKEFMKIWLEADLPLDDEMLLLYYPKTPGRAREMMEFYLERYRESFLKECEIIAIEEAFIIPLSDEDTLMYYMGRWDKIYEYRNRIYITDHKTTKSDKSQWANSFSPNNQIDGYLTAGHAVYGDRFWGVMIDGALCQKGSKKIDGLPPGIGFPKIPIQRAFGHLEGWRWETIYTILMLRHNLDLLEEASKEQCNHLKAFPKNTTACSNYGGCTYMDICKTVTNPNEMEMPEDFKVSIWSPLTMEEVNED